MSMAEYYGGELDVPEMAERLAAYLSSSMKAQEVGMTAAIPRRDMHPAIAALLGIDVTRSLSQKEAANLMRVLTTTGADVEGKRTFKSTADKVRLGYTDFTFSAPKEFSIALALAPTGAERAMLEECFIRANDAMMDVVLLNIGTLRSRVGAVDGDFVRTPMHLATVAYDHYTARPTLAVQVEDAGATDTVLVNLPTNIPSMPNRHRHNIIPHVGITDDGRVGSPDLKMLDGNLHTWGALGHAFLTRFLGEHGVTTERDSKTGLSRLSDVPRPMVKAYSARQNEGEDLARDYAAKKGMDWDNMDATAKREMVGQHVRWSKREKERSKAGSVDYNAWLAIAKAHGYEHRSVLRPDDPKEILGQEERARVAYGEFLKLMEPEWKGRAKLDGSVLRTMAARAHIAVGISDDPLADIGRVTAAARTEGVMQDGRLTAIRWKQEGEKPYASVTTNLHIEEEREAIGLMSKWQADRTAAVPQRLIDTKIGEMEARGIDFSTEHGATQLQMGLKFAGPERVVIGIGGAGSGKSTVLELPIWTYQQMGWETYGVTQAWRQTHGLVDAGVARNSRTPDVNHLVEAGINPDRALALEAFFVRAERGLITLNDKTLIAGDELGTLSTRDVLRMHRLQDQHGFKYIGTGDGQQCGAIDAGDTMHLYERGLGKEHIPSIVGSIRQQNLEDRETSLMFRNGEAEQALVRKASGGKLHLVDGSYTDLIKGAVDEWERRIAANSTDPKYSIGLTVPDNADAHAVGLEVRKRMRAAGRITGDDTKVAAIDQRGHESVLDIAVGDEVRLFNRVNARYSDKSRGYFGENATVATVVSIAPNEHIQLRRADGKVGTVRWGSLTDKLTGRIRLAYGSALTINARQSATLTDHITLAPSGTKDFSRQTIYPADTRNKRDSLLFVSRGAEMEEVRNRRPMGDPWLSEATRPEMDSAILKNMARNLAEDKRKGLAVAFIGDGKDVFQGAVSSRQAAWFRNETPAQPAAEPDLSTKFRDKQETDAVVKVLVEIRKLTHRPSRKVARDIERAARPPSPRPKPKPPRERPKLDETAVRQEFADALRAEGFVLKGLPEMDGKWRYEVVASKHKKKGRYRGFIEGIRPAGAMQSFKGGSDVVKWKYKGAVEPRSDAQRYAEEARRVDRENAERGAREIAAVGAARAWATARPTTHQAYLDKKGIQAHDLRADRRGRLLVAMRDPETLAVRNVQTIGPDGLKLFAKDAQVVGLMGLMGEIDPAKPIALAEGMATAATWHEATGFTTAYAFTSGNLLAVAKDLRRLYPMTPIIIAGDNDHHLPRRAPALPNAGREKAEAAAVAVGGIAIIPSFGNLEMEPMRAGASPPTDWNDFAKMNGAGGHAKIYAIAEEQLKAQGIAMPEKMKPVERATISQAERDAARQAAGSKPQAQARNEAQIQAQRQSQTQRNSRAVKQ